MAEEHNKTLFIGVDPCQMDGGMEILKPEVGQEEAFSHFAGSDVVYGVTRTALPRLRKMAEIHGWEVVER